MKMGSSWGHLLRLHARTEATVVLPVRNTLIRKQGWLQVLIADDVKVKSSKGSPGIKRITICE